jgi:hypothetical protein
MANQNTDNSGTVPADSSDRENLQSQPDYSATLKDIELNLLRELLKDGVGIADDSNKALAEIIHETHVRNRRSLFVSVALMFLIIGVLSFIGYNKLAALKEGELETRRAISAIEKRIVAKGPLDGTSSAGKFVLYPRGEPKGYETGKRVCALSATYPWASTKESLREYLGKKVFLSIAGFETMVDFTIVDFFSPKDQNRIIQIPMRSVESLVGPRNADKYIMKGVMDGKVVFPE